MKENDMTNNDILKAFESTICDDNANKVKELIGSWDTTEAFPIERAMRYIKMQQWSYDRFNFGTISLFKSSGIKDICLCVPLAILDNAAIGSP